LENNSIETSASQTLEDFEMVLNIAIHLLRGSAFLTSSEAKAKPRITLFVLIGYFLLEKSRQKTTGSLLETQEDYEKHTFWFLSVHLSSKSGRNRKYDSDILLLKSNRDCIKITGLEITFEKKKNILGKRGRKCML
jgi:hypothetical protein